jgi:Polysaccharide deacetylase
MPRLRTARPFEERGGRLRGVLDLVAGRYPRFVFGGPVGPLLPVFHFHDVTRETLEPALAYLADNDYRTVVSDEAAALAREGRHPGSRTVMLAFDDAWASLWQVAAPLLRRYGMRAVTYAIPGRIAEAATTRPTVDDGRGEPAGQTGAPTPFVTWPELRELSASGVIDVQSHTWSHSMIFCGDQVVGRVTPAWADEPPLNRPRIDRGAGLEFLSPDRIGFPLLACRSRMADGLRFFPDPDACDAIYRETQTGGRNDPSTIPGRWETPGEQVKAIEEELIAGRDILEQRLTTRVRHICLPWGVSGTITRRALERTGYITAFANRMSGQFAVAAGDDPFYLKRLHERHLFTLPGRGRRTVVSRR